MTPSAYSNRNLYVPCSRCGSDIVINSAGSLITSVGRILKLRCGFDDCRAVDWYLESELLAVNYPGRASKSGVESRPRRPGF